MVILQFNKLIRNKWVWGVFAIAISAFFAFDFLIADLGRDDDREQNSGEAGTLAGKAVDAKLFQELADEARGLGRNRDWKADSAEINRTAWENYAALEVAAANGIESTDAEVSASIRSEQAFQVNGQFSFAKYQALLRENGIVPERFEESLKRRNTLGRIAQAVLGSAAWASPMEVDRAVADMTDVFTVKVANFAQEKKDADAVKLDDAGLRKWYDDNVKSLELPERLKIRYVRFDANAKDVLAKMSVTTNEMHDLYDATVDQYTTTDTNGVEKVKKFEEVVPELEQKLRKIAAVQFFETNLSQRVYAVKAAEGSSRLDEIAKEDKLQVQTSGWFTLDGAYKEGFMQYASTVCPGAQGFNEAIAELDSSSDDLRYGIISSESAVWLVEKSETSPKHTPSFDEAKDIIRGRALEAAKADAFKASVEAVAKKGADAIRALKDVSTNFVFSVSDLQPGQFPDQMAVARAAMKLAKGEVSEFVRTGRSTGILVLCEERTTGDAAKAMVLRSQLVSNVTMLQQRSLPEAWRKWNLARLGFETGALSSLEKVETEE